MMVRSRSPWVVVMSGAFGRAGLAGAKASCRHES
jgi:hypothetical protein